MNMFAQRETVPVSASDPVEIMAIGQFAQFTRATDAPLRWAKAQPGTRDAFRQEVRAGIRALRAAGFEIKRTR